MADPLITLERYKTALGLNPLTTSPDDDKYEAAIDSASMLVRNFTHLTFEIAGTGALAATRQFEYDGSGYVDIDEAQSISAVGILGNYSGATSRALTQYEWSAYPLRGPVKTWIRVPVGIGGISPEMGFAYNLDTLYYKYPTTPGFVTITAIWGWPYIPADVQQAVIWTATSIAETQRPYQQESIESYSRTRGPSDSAESLPERAQVALMPYIIPNL